jgi:ADP-L-glycero-D-manno-heptose 6-epimerase
MILVTGGAGFIGSNLHAALVAHGHETVVADRLHEGSKWRNLAHHPPGRIVVPEALEDFLARDPPLAMVFHLGAVSDTCATDGDLVWRNNVAASQRLWEWCASREVRLVYASSAATYGNGTQGFADDAELSYLRRLRPLNLYGWSKHAFDLWVAGALARGEPRPPQWAGLKFFNVYGPNEYHKGAMISVVKVKYDEVAAGLRPRLFRSDRPGIADGEQRRDFVWVGDTVDVMLWLLETPRASGLFNVGTGVARTFLELAQAVCRAADRQPDVDFIDMPASLRGRYQSFTEAPIERLRAAGFAPRFTPLEAGIHRYVRDYLRQADPYV